MKPQRHKQFRNKDQKPYKPAERSFKKRVDKEARPQKERLRVNLWGVHAVTEAWLNPERRIKHFYVTEQALKGFLPVYEKAKSEGISRPLPQIIEKAQLDRSLNEAVHQGLALDTEPLDEVFVHDLITSAARAPKSTLVMLDQVTDPHNAGAILRSAAAFGAVGMIMQSRNAPEINATLSKAACGAVEHVPIAYETNLGRALTHLKENGYVSIGLDERGATDIAAVDVPARVVLVLGAEGKGLRQGLREQCDVLASLPTQGPIRSLNVSNAAAVALYALNKKSGG